MRTAATSVQTSPNLETLKSAPVNVEKKPSKTRVQVQAPATTTAPAPTQTQAPTMATAPAPAQAQAPTMGTDPAPAQAPAQAPEQTQAQAATPAQAQAPGTPASTETQQKSSPLTPKNWPKPIRPMYHPERGFGRSAPTMDLGTMLEFVFSQNQIFDNLPEKLQKGLKKVYKMTKDPFKYASENVTASEEREAIFGLGGREEYLNDVVKFVDKIVGKRDIPKSVENALISASEIAKKEIQALRDSRAQEKAQKQQQKQMERERREDEKRESIIQRYNEKVQRETNQNEAINQLKNLFSKSNHYARIFKALPTEIVNELKKLSMDPDNIKYLSSPDSRLASISVVNKYLSHRN